MKIFYKLHAAVSSEQITIDLLGVVDLCISIYSIFKNKLYGRKF